MRYFITGGAGFCGSHLTDRLINKGHRVVVYDNLSLGRKKYLQSHFSNPQFKFIEADLLDFRKLQKSMKGADVVFHLAANSDIIKSVKYPKIDFEQGTVATYNVLEAMRLNGIKKIVFSSSNVVYGEANFFPIPEDYGPLIPISFYGASKLACEGLITAYCHNFGFKSWIYRFVNLIGKRTTHGVVIDFYKKLQKNKNELEVLGNGKQTKPYIEIQDCVDGMLFGMKKSSEDVNIFNLGTDGATSVSKIAELVINELGLNNVKIKYSGGVRGWPGDVPFVSVDIMKLKSLGWNPKYPTSDEAVQFGIKILVDELKTRFGKIK